MKAVEFWRWWITDEFGRRYATTYRMQRSEALKLDPNAEPVHGTGEIRHLPESDAERAANLTGAWQRTRE